VVCRRRADLARPIKDETEGEIHDRTVGDHLAALGFRRLSMRPQNPKSDEEAQAALKKLRQQGSRSLIPIRRCEIDHYPRMGRTMTVSRRWYDWFSASPLRGTISSIS